MANLIITIISIALVAVAAIMGAYYGGTAFVQGQTKAYANTSVSQGDQISAAWSVYSAQNGGNWAAISDVSQLSVSPTYLASVPIAPPQVGTSVSTAQGGHAESTWHMADLTNTGTTPTTSTNQNGVYYRLTDDNNGSNTCNYVSQIAAGTAASPTSISTSTNLTVGNTAQRKFDCVYYASVSTLSGAPPIASTNPKYIYYRSY